MPPGTGIGWRSARTLAKDLRRARCQLQVGYGGLAQRAKAKPWEKVDGQATGKPVPCWTEHPAVPPLRDTKG